MDATRRPPGQPDANHPALQAIVSAEMMTHDTGMATTVVLPRTPTAVSLARKVARQHGTQVTAEIEERGIKLRFTGSAPTDQDDSVPGDPLG
jgi:hypothetical protein